MSKCSFSSAQRLPGKALCLTSTLTLALLMVAASRRRAAFVPNPEKTRRSRACASPTAAACAETAAGTPTATGLQRCQTPQGPKPPRHDGRHRLEEKSNCACPMRLGHPQAAETPQPNGRAARNRLFQSNEQTRQALFVCVVHKHCSLTRKPSLVKATKSCSAPPSPGTVQEKLQAPAVERSR